MKKNNKAKKNPTARMIEKIIALILQENGLTETEAEITTYNICECYRLYPEKIKLKVAAISYVLKISAGICWL